MEEKIIKIVKYKCPICGELFNEDITKFEGIGMKNHEKACKRKQNNLKNLQKIAEHYGYDLYNKDHRLIISENLFAESEKEHFDMDFPYDKHFCLPDNVIIEPGYFEIFINWSRWPHKNILHIWAWNSPKDIIWFEKIVKVLGGNPSKELRKYIRKYKGINNESKILDKVI